MASTLANNIIRRSHETARIVAAGQVRAVTIGSGAIGQAPSESVAELDLNTRPNGLNILARNGPASEMCSLKWTKRTSFRSKSPSPQVLHSSIYLQWDRSLTSMPRAESESKAWFTFHENEFFQLFFRFQVLPEGRTGLEFEGFQQNRFCQSQRSSSFTLRCAG